ncbi:uncharacterized protein LOC134237332 isoform X1 [Saccostrea cucullata]|uniref:uncharacterized protein LOC134237332 isoform X1 n=2 Tax=Saccostrea cuccullata TaxID=36930 RepID=UPI002ED02516
MSLNSIIDMAFPKLREFMGEVKKFLDTGVKPFQMSSILPRGAKRELDSAVPMLSGFRPSKVYYMFAVLSFADLGSWDEVKTHGPKALEEFRDFMEELPTDERNTAPVSLPPKETIITQDYPQKSSARFRTSNENMQYYSPRRPEQNTRAPSIPSQRRSHDGCGSNGSHHVSSRPSPSNPSQRMSYENSKQGSYGQIQENGQDNDGLKNDIANSISKLRQEIGSLKDRLSEELSQPDVVNTPTANIPPLNTKSPRSSRTDDVTDKLAEAFSGLLHDQWLGALKERNNGQGHSEKNLIYLADITKKCQHYLDDVCEREFTHLCEIILKPMGEKDSQYVHISEDLRALARTRCRQIQRDTMPISLPVIKEVVIRDKISEAQKNPALKRFVDRCVELLWMFAIHDPPLELEWARAGDTMGSHLQSYSDTGNRVGFNVWPTLRQFRNGPVLCKGVVQMVY